MEATRERSRAPAEMQTAPAGHSDAAAALVQMASLFLDAV